MSETKGKKPPSASEDDLIQINQRLDALNLSPSPVPTEDLCITHLKFLHSLHLLREDVATNGSLFDITPPHADLATKSGEDGEAKMRARVREKRWQVYVTVAVYRFEKWIEFCVVPMLQGTTQGPLRRERPVSSNAGLRRSPIGSLVIEKNLPPLDVLMVWHAYLLNPRCFFEDCLRPGRLDVYATYFPWPLITKCIDSNTFGYSPPSGARKIFERGTGPCWDNLADLSKT